jgi:undecaprenyl-diphosphatase
MNFFLEVIGVAKKQILANKKILLYFAIILTALIIGAVSGAALRMVNSSAVARLDKSVGEYIFSWRSSILDTFFKYLTLLCGSKVAALISVLSLLTLIFLKKKGYILPLLVSALGSSLFTALSKILVARPRPVLEALVTEDSFSFPSGHATAALGVYGFLFLLLLLNIRGKIAKSVIYFLAIIFTVLIGVSRIYLGVHYFSDVLVGYLIGGLWLWLSAKLLSSRF